MNEKVRNSGRFFLSGLMLAAAFAMCLVIGTGEGE